MKHTVFKVFSLGAYEKEEKWLNEMSAKGMMLTDVGFCKYTFEECIPGEYIYRLELLHHLPFQCESDSYIKFLEDTGIEYVGSYLRWGYFRKKAQDGVFELYSDVDSKIEHYKRITLIANVLFVFLACMSITWLWEAWNKYYVYTTWIERGFNCKQYHIPFMIKGTLFGILAITFQLIIIPIRKSMHSLKKEQKIRE
ncbi:MAG: DUF2812 domain-containing protein [Vallitalea sp.]|jgi:hypothetical protein|nr:DUF2812 domain-containing protein [Vallitalea sp.]